MALQLFPRERTVISASFRFLVVTSVAATFVLSLAGSHSPSARAVAGDDVEYTFGPPVKKGEQTYAWYRKTHGDAAAQRYGADPAKVGDGMDTWHWWCGVNNPEFWRKFAVYTAGKQNVANVRQDFLRMLHSTSRADRWEKMGLINDPDTVAADQPDKYGLKLDRCKDGALTWDPEVFGYPSGVIGFQLFVNENFDEDKWSIEKYLADPASVEPPYNVGMACALCHVSFNPTRPPKDPVNPEWENLTSAIGNQFFREGMMVGSETPRTTFAYQYLYHQQPGTSETSRYPSDFINGPVQINAIYRLGERLKLTKEERITPAQRDLIKSMYAHVGLKENDAGGALGGTEAEPTLKVPHVLADGADSMGVLVASTRVYVNEGCMHGLWVPATWALNPFDIKESIRKNFQPGEFDLISTARKDPNSPWMQTELRMPNMALFLSTHDSFPLADAKDPEPSGKQGKDYLTADADTLLRGKIAFADNCARCHSSKVPEALAKDRNALANDPEALKKAWRDLVCRDDFLANNYLSDDDRYPVSELGTNAQRAMGTNAMAGHTWGQMSSQTYKDQRKPIEQLHDWDAAGKPMPLYNPLTGKHDIVFSGNRAFYRTPPLVSIWATAPYLHNNSVGMYTGDPSVAGRMSAYEDGMTKLLSPELRLGVKSIKATTEDTTLPDIFPVLKETMPEFADLPALQVDALRVPKGTPINLFMNVHPKDVKAVVQAYVDGVLQGAAKSQFAVLQPKNHHAGLSKMLTKLTEVNLCPDFIEDRGHWYGRDLSSEDKRALIEYMKLF